MNKLKLSDSIIYQDDNWLILNKPSGLASSFQNIEGPNATSWVKEEYPNAQNCHRIDKETSGCLLFALHQEAYKTAINLFTNRKMIKRYEAVACGYHLFNQFEINEPLAATNRGKAKIDHSKGKEALTLVNVIQAFKHYTHLECFPKTGRLHQIRVHLAHYNAQLVMDSFYKGCIPYLSALKRKKFNLGKEKDEQPMIKRLALHAESLSFQAFGEKITVQAPYPKDFAVFIKLLKKYA